MNAAMQSSESTAPVIAPGPVGQHRPLWSVMIPTFNCAHYLRLTLQSVLAQDLGPEAMQIEVVDDCSTKDDPEAVVREVGKGRVQFFRKAHNGGAIANFNTCIERSRGHLVHILHGDDYVAAGFFEVMGMLAAHHSDCALLACRSFYINENGVIQGVSPRVSRLEHGGHDASDFFYGNPILTPGVVIRRNFYEQYGGFLPTLVHCADWEMWARAIDKGVGVISPDVLSFYRDFAANDTSRLRRTAENLRDVKRTYEVLMSRHSDLDPRYARNALCCQAAIQIERFRTIGDHEAVSLNRRFLNERATIGWRLRNVIRSIGRAILSD